MGIVRQGKMKVQDGRSLVFWLVTMYTGALSFQTMTLDEHHEAWRKTGEGMDRHHVYTRIAEKTHLGEGIHVDIGFGAGHLLQRLCGLYPHAILLGLETSPQMIEDTRARLAPREAHVALEKGSAKPLNPDRDKGLIELLQADFRSVGVLDDLLKFCAGGIASATYTFPGGVAAEKGSTVPAVIDRFDPNEFHELIYHELRIKALGAVTAGMKPGGIFFLGERYFSGGTFDIRAERTRWFEILQHHGMVPYWALGNIEILDRIPASELGRSIRKTQDPQAPGKLMAPRPDEEAIVGLLPFIRSPQETSSQNVGHRVEIGLQKIIYGVIQTLRKKIGR